MESDLPMEPNVRLINQDTKIINRKSSVEIYNQLINGRMVNRSVFHDGSLIPNPLFEELLNSFDHYRRLYADIGFELVMREGFAFIRTPGSSDQVEDAVRRTQGMLLVLFRGVMEQGLTMDALIQDKGGLSNELIEVIGNGEDKIEVLHACGMKNSLLVEIKMLENRGIAYRNAKGYLVLTEAGVAFYRDLIDGEDV